jgi:predicted lipoprotein
LPPYQAAFDVWTGIADIRLGPSEAAVLSIAFWPDERGSGMRALQQMLATGDPAMSDPAAFADVTVAARGFSGLDLLLGDPSFAYGPDDPACTLVRTATDDLARQARTLAAEWAAHAAKLRDPGGAGNLTYLDADEARSAVFSQIVTGLMVTADSRLVRPLGTFDSPRPTRSEAWRTGRPLGNALASARAGFGMAELLAGQPLPRSAVALEAVEHAAAAIGDPSFQDIGSDPSAWLKVDILRQRIIALKTAIETELTVLSGVSLGFNATDGD